MIRREVTPVGLILVRGGGRVELHDMAGNIVEGHDATAAEQAEQVAWEASLAPSERLKRPARLKNPAAAAPAPAVPAASIDKTRGRTP